MKLRIIFIAFLICSFLGNTFAQHDLDSQVPKDKKYTPLEVIKDPTYGIQIYEPLNIKLGGDSSRMCKGYSCAGWIEDFYTTGKILHKGYYVEGQLKIYKNFWPNGAPERDYKQIDDNKSQMRKFYPDGTLKSIVKYYDKDPIKWQDFYANGNIEYDEEYHKSMEYYLAQISYFENGTPESVFELVNKKKLSYDKKEYYEDGKLKLAGQMVYDKNSLDYVPIGKWMEYYDNGNVQKETTYMNGKPEKVVEH